MRFSLRSVKARACGSMVLAAPKIRFPDNKYFIVSFL
jgi:hypothetical protein